MKFIRKIFMFFKRPCRKKRCIYDDAVGNYNPCWSCKYNFGNEDWFEENKGGKDEISN